jgi:hypothetical protein
MAYFLCVIYKYLGRYPKKEEDEKAEADNEKGAAAEKKDDKME